jgi:hypothetical protein
MDRTVQGMILVLLGLMVVIMGDAGSGLCVMGMGAMVVITEFYHRHLERLAESEREIAKWEMMEKIRKEKEAKEQQEAEWLEQRRKGQRTMT